MPTPVLDHPVDELPVAIMDLETTGLYAGGDRIVEVAVVRVEPGAEPALVVDTLINPGRRVAATEIHGITDEDVADAPRFGDVAGDVARALSGSVVAAYNVYFDIRFLEDEFTRCGLEQMPPHVCLMYLRPLLGLGNKCCLSDACRAHGIEQHGSHVAAMDALTCSRLWGIYQRSMSEQGIRTYRDLTKRKSYKFLQSFDLAPLPRSVALRLRRGGHFKSRRVPAGITLESRVAGVREYWDALKATIADMVVTPEELVDLRLKRERLGLTDEEVRAVHGRVFAAVLGETLEDARVTEEEWERLRRIHSCLAELGWAPGH